jgi:endonuclease/exonuclease/phosphatase family metal-dependent hydrolase
MGKKLKTMVLSFLMLINVLLVFAFLVSSYASYLHPKEFWFTGFLGLFFPYFLFCLLFFLVFWLFVKKWWALLSLIGLLVGYRTIQLYLPFNWNGDFQIKKEEQDLRVMSWNVRHFIPFDESTFKPDKLKHREEVFDQIRKYNPDVICLQEFISMPDDGKLDPFTFLKKELGYKYFQFAGKDIFGTRQYSGIAIFSKYPIIDGNTLPFPENFESNTEPPVYADILLSGDTVRVYSIHLQSFGFGAKEYRTIDDINSNEDKDLIASRKLVSKMKNTFYVHGLQSDYIVKDIETSPHPVIVAGDLNDIAGSYAYATIRGGRRDAFLEKGDGLGATFMSSSSSILQHLPTLRIDYIFHPEEYPTRQFTRSGKKLSDHYFLVTDLTLP